MAIDIIKQLRAAATSNPRQNSNVLAFPPRAAPSKPCRKPRKAKRANVLAFTGKSIRNIDGPACLPGWKKTMVEQLTNAIAQVLDEEITGLLLVKTTEFPEPEGVMAGTVIACGALSADLGALERQARWIEDKAHELAEDSPARWV